jgi:hypothetical protein
MNLGQEYQDVCVWWGACLPVGHEAAAHLRTAMLPKLPNPQAVLRLVDVQGLSTGENRSLGGV